MGSFKETALLPTFNSDGCKHTCTQATFIMQLHAFHPRMGPEVTYISKDFKSGNWTVWPWLSLWNDVIDDIQGHLTLLNRPQACLCFIQVVCVQDLEAGSEGPGREGAGSRVRYLPPHQHLPRLKGRSLGLQSPSQRP